MVKRKNILQLDKKYKNLKSQQWITIIVKDKIMNVVWLGWKNITSQKRKEEIYNKVIMM